MCDNIGGCLPDTHSTVTLSAQKVLEPDEVIAAIAHVLEKAGIATAAIGSELGFRVHGENGGDWVVDLSSPGGAWKQPSDPEVVERCKTTLYAEREAFSHLITEPERIEDDLKSGILEIDGERQALARLGRLLRSSGGLLKQRSRMSKTTTNRRFKPWR
jgi:hypothetical protein